MTRATKRVVKIRNAIRDGLEFRMAVRKAALAAGWNVYDPSPSTISYPKIGKGKRIYTVWRWGVAAKGDGFRGSVMAPTYEQLYQTAGKVLGIKKKGGSK